MSDAPLRLGLVGSPNSGKTTLFNALTGLRAKVGNYPGVTVERREGEVRGAPRRIVMMDLPGAYSLDPISPDEAVVGKLLAGELENVPPPDALVVSADACTLERALVLVAQVLRTGLPVVLIVTMLDELRARGGALDTERLARALGIPVLGVIGHRGKGLGALRRLLPEPARWERPALAPPTAPDERRAWGASLLARAGFRAPGASRSTEALDRFVLHPLLGPLLFAGVMLFFFQAIFAWAVPMMDALDAGIAALGAFVRGALPESAHVLRDFLADGVIAGVGAVLVFLPQIVLLFALLTLLEGIGYMARAAFVVDRAMGRIGLEGRAFVALLSSYACAIPGIMATRTIPSPRQRLLTILVAPLMTCSARLPVYALLIGAFVPPATLWGFLGVQGLVLFALYIAGAAAAMGAAALLGRTLLAGAPAPFYLELPPYRVPPLKLVASQVWTAASAFLRRAGTIILLTSMVLWVLLNFPHAEAPPEATPAQAAAHRLEHSAAGTLGHALEPALAPIGFDWKIGVGLVASLAAREVIVATLAQMYAAQDGEQGLRDALRADRRPDGTPVYTPATVASLLVFFVFALQCMSTLATMWRETDSWRWPVFAFSYLLALAYGASFVTYRLVSALT